MTSMVMILVTQPRCLSQRRIGSSRRKSSPRVRARKDRTAHEVNIIVLRSPMSDVRLRVTSCTVREKLL